MRKIIGIGETVFDIIFRNGQPQAAKAGGAVLNSAVSMGRAGLPVSFVSEYGKDDVGAIIDDFLTSNGVNTSSVYRFQDGKTALALAFLDEKSDAHYSFYQNYPADRLNIRNLVTAADDIILCGSFYAIWPEIRPIFRDLIMSAKKNGAMVIYDPNFRSSHLTELDSLKPMIIENMKMADLIRGSNEDFANIFGTGSIDEAYEVVKPYCNVMIYTASVDGVYVRTPSFKGNFPVRKIDPVSTIGAGDNFNAGMITSIYKQELNRDKIKTLGEKEWTDIISMAVDFATHVCLSYENYISVEFAETIK
jgi:fructokinase